MMKKEYYKPTVAVISLFTQTIICGSDDYVNPGTETHIPPGEATAPARKLYI